MPGGGLSPNRPHIFIIMRIAIYAETQEELDKKVKEFRKNNPGWKVKAVITDNNGSYNP